MTWQDSNDALQGIMVGPDAHPSTLTMGDSTSNPLLDIHLNTVTDLGSLEAHHPHSQSFLNPWSSSTETQNYYYPNYAARMISAQDAWNPLQVTGVPNPAPSTSLHHLNVSSAGDAENPFHKPHYRTPSDSGSQYMGSLMSGDSGYGSNHGAAQSVVASSYGIDSSPHISAKEHGFGEALALYDRAQVGSGQMFVRDTGDAASLSFEPVKCDHPSCSWVGKCPSDKRKHEARHRKLFKCDEPNCPRKEGFGTINDLARHKKCVHNKEPERGPKMMYLCFGKNCPRPNKHWPRLDNFKQHLSRMHHEEDADSLLKRSMDWYESVTGHRGQKIDDTSSQEDSSSDIQQDTVSTHSGEMEADPIDSSYCSYETGDFPSSQGPTPNSVHNTSTLEVPPNQPSHFQLGSLGLSPSLASDTRDMTIERNNANPETFVADAADNLITAMTKKMNNRPRRQSQHSDEGIELEDNANLSQPQRQMLQKVLLAALERLSDENSTAPEPSDNKQDWFQCEICSKKTRLRCEMKKHQKRHERPYGCTFPHCAKSFGSKADWKRHESSQHLHMTSWLCHSHDPSKNASCGRIFYREETYIQHLSQMHRVPKNKLKSTLSTSRLDVADSDRFWCGFCNKVVGLSCSGTAALDERFNHIDVEHFKKGERGVDWRFPGSVNNPGFSVRGNGCNDLEDGFQVSDGDERRKRRCPGL